MTDPCAKHHIRFCPVCRDRSDEFPAAPAAALKGRRYACEHGPYDSLSDCPICGPQIEPESGPSPSPAPSTHAPARETGPFFADGGNVRHRALPSIFAQVNAYRGEGAEKRHARARQIADGLNLLHAVGAGTAGAGAAAPLEVSIPIPMVLHCPRCGLQHVDRPEPEIGWTNPPHKSHLCQGCGCIWRPAEVPTCGVDGLRRVGDKDTWTPGEPTLHDELVNEAEHCPDALPAVMAALLEVRHEFPQPAAAAALDEALRRVAGLGGTGLPEQAGQQDQARRRHDLAGILAPFPEPERFTRRPCGEGLECPGDRSPFELRGGGLFQDGKRIASCETPEAGRLLIAALEVAESAASFRPLPKHPVDALRTLAVRWAADAGLGVDHAAFDRARDYVDEVVDAPKVEPYRAEGVNVLTADGLIVASCSVLAIGSASKRELGNMAQEIVDALNEIEAKVCEECFELVGDHAPDCARRAVQRVFITPTGEQWANIRADCSEAIGREVRQRMAEQAVGRKQDVA